MVKSYALYVVVIYLYMVQTKSSYISRAESNFYGAEIEIWAGLGPDDITAKRDLKSILKMKTYFLTCD